MIFKSFISTFEMNLNLNVLKVMVPRMKSRLADLPTTTPVSSDLNLVDFSES